MNAVNNTGNVHYVHVVTTGTCSSGNWISTAGTNYNPYYPKSVIDTVVKDDTIEITYIQRAMYTYTTYNSNLLIGGQQPQYHNEDKVFKEIYGVKDNKLTLLETVYGRIIPPQLEETYEFPE